MRMFKSVSLFISALLISIYSFGQENNNVVANLVFKDYFKGDVGTLIINNHLITKNELLETSIPGLTNVRVDIEEIDGALISRYYKEVVPLRKLPKLKVKVVVNGVSNTFNIDLKKGTFIGFNKSKYGVTLEQSKRPFLYD